MRTPLCAECGLAELQHYHEFVPGRDHLPEGCVCDPRTWGDGPSAVCSAYSPQPRRADTNCATCEHDRECHASDPS